jgi:hypothetical protein
MTIVRARGAHHEIRFSREPFRAALRALLRAFCKRSDQKREIDARVGGRRRIAC